MHHHLAARSQPLYCREWHSCPGASNPGGSRTEACRAYPGSLSAPGSKHASPHSYASANPRTCASTAARGAANHYAGDA